MANKIEYLVKFVKEKKHADDLLKGELFMRPSVAFIKMFYDDYFKSYPKYDEQLYCDFVKNYKGCIGDFTEARLMSKSSMKANTHIPIFCMTYVSSAQMYFDEDVCYLKFYKKTVNEFINAGYKYAVVIEYKKFEELLLKEYSEKKNIGGFGPVIYSKLNDAQSIKDCLGNMNYGKNLLYKDSYFKYQSEFRIYLSYSEKRYSQTLYDNCYKIYSYDKNDKENTFHELTELPFHIEKIGSIQDFSKIFKISDFRLNNNEYILNLGVINE